MGKEKERKMGEGAWDGKKWDSGGVGWSWNRSKVNDGGGVGG